METITSTELRGKIGVYVEKALAEPVSITRHGRQALVLLSAEEYRTLKTKATERPTRQAFKAGDLPDEVRKALQEVDYSHLEPELDKLMD